MIVVLTDQQRWDTTDVSGNWAGATSEFGRPAREGGLVQHAITPDPVCAPARPSLRTGLYPTATGCSATVCHSPATCRTSPKSSTRPAMRPGRPASGSWRARTGPTGRSLPSGTAVTVPGSPRGWSSPPTPTGR
ncbi:sulfatase-like hydrolase/transferase [Streptomyces achromogenes]|uniref:sulfatase-like hydrolase/transferase n=1 Tax=Streptomyces achromogenes TaxID=67255 RepID=UPI003A7F6B0A